MPSSEQAENSKPTGKRKLPKEAERFKFKPGQSGNPGGRPKKRPITEIYERILADEQNVNAIEKMIVAMLKQGRMASQLQLKEMAERVEGKVTQPVELEINMTLAQRMEKAAQRAKAK
jgi:hypothetical protein